MVMLSVVRAARLGAVATTLVLCGAAAGEVRLAAIDAPAERIRDGERVELRAHLLTPPRPSPFGASAEVAVTSGRLRGARLLRSEERRVGKVCRSGGATELWKNN